jgi:hypothetical protein
MAIIFTKPRRKEVYHLIFVIVFLVIFTIILVNLFRKATSVVSIKSIEIHPPAINFSNLNDPILAKLKPYPTIEEFTGILGRDIPFLPSTTTLATTTPTVPLPISP